MKIPGLNKMFSKEKDCVGLDIGTHSLKFIKLKFAGASVELNGFGIEQASVDMVELLKKIRQLYRIDCVNIATSGPSAVIRYATFPRMNRDELKQALKFEAQKHIPFSLAEVNLDSYILKDELPDNKMLVLLAAAKKDFINQRLRLIEEAGLRTNIIDMDSLALVNAFNFYPSQEEEPKHKAVALLNIGAAISNLNILEKDIPRLSRDINIAGNNFSQKISDILGVDFKAADNLKLNPPSDKLNSISSAVEVVLSNLASEIRKSFDFFESQSASSVNKIFLSGGGSKFPGLKEILSNLLSIEVDYWDLLKTFTVSDKIDYDALRSNYEQYAVAMGLALRR